MTKNSALIKVTIAIILAVIVGALSGPDNGIAGIPFVKFYDLAGQLFLNALTLVVVPLVAASIITGSARIGAEGSFGSLGLKTFGYFILTTSLAVLAGYFVVIWMAPGVGHAITTNPAATPTALAQLSTDEGGFAKIGGLLLKLFPPNILAAASQGQMIGLIPFCLLFGYFMMKIDSPLSTTLLSFWQGIFQVMMRITHVIMKALPYGVFALVAKVVAISGLDAFLSVAWFFMTFVIALGIYFLVILPLLLKLMGGLSPLAHFRAMGPALLTAFSTSSSAATLPIALECMEERAGVSNRICSFIFPLGASINLSATALYECVVVFFIAQAYGIELTLPTQFIILLMSLLTSMGLAGIPSGSLIGIVTILHAVGLPTEGIALVLAVERFCDMLRTTVNVFGCSCCTALVAKSEGENNLYPALPTKSPSHE
jgi:Na+/H+-dicarboxylate symporter